MTPEQFHDLANIIGCSVLGALLAGGVFTLAIISKLDRILERLPK